MGTGRTQKINYRYLYLACRRIFETSKVRLKKGFDEHLDQTTVIRTRVSRHIKQLLTWHDRINMITSSAKSQRVVVHNYNK